MSALLLDDRLLLDRLLGGGSAALRALSRRRSVFTSGLWYYRLCHAVRSETITGALSGPFAAAPSALKAKAAVALLELPDDVGLVSLRVLGPLMADLVERHRLNALSLEALAAGLHLDAAIAIARGSENPTLIDAAKVEGVAVHIIATG